MRRAIIVGQRGFVWVGFVEYGPDDVTLHESRTVIRWGTTEGLEQLANDGPTGETNLSAKLEGPRRIHRLAVVQDIACKEEPWLTLLP